MMRLSLNIHLSEMEFKISSIFQGFKNSEEKSIHLYSNYSNYFLKIIVRKISPMKIIIGILQDKNECIKTSIFTLKINSSNLHIIML